MLVFGLRRQAQVLWYPRLLMGYKLGNPIRELEASVQILSGEISTKLKPRGTHNHNWDKKEELISIVAQNACEKGRRLITQGLRCNSCSHLASSWKECCCLLGIPLSESGMLKGAGDSLSCFLDFENSSRCHHREIPFFWKRWEETTVFGPQNNII